MEYIITDEQAMNRCETAYKNLHYPVDVMSPVERKLLSGNQLFPHFRTFLFRYWGPQDMVPANSFEF